MEKTNRQLLGQSVFIGVLALVGAVLTLLFGSTAQAAERQEVTQGSITVHKLYGDPIGETTIINNGQVQDTKVLKPLENVEFTIASVTKAELQAAGTLVKENKYGFSDFDFSKISQSKKVRGVTDKAGQIKFEQLKVVESEDNLYIIVETGDKTNPTYPELGGVYQKAAPIIVTLPMMNTEGTGFNYDINVYPKSDFALANAKLHKVDGQSDSSLAGAVFKLFSVGSNQQIGETFTTNEAGNIIVKDLPLGAYYFEEIAAPAGYLVNAAAQKIAFEIKAGVNGKTLNVVYQNSQDDRYNNQASIPNYQEPTIEKTVDQPSVAYGQNRRWEIAAVIPENINDHSVFNVIDRLDPRLVYTDNLSVTVDGKELAPTNYTVTKTSEGSQELRVDFIKAGKVTADFSAHAGKKVVISFTTKLIEGLLPDINVPNTAELNFTNVPGVNGKPGQTTPPTNPEITTGGYHFKKVRQTKNGEALAGAEFVVMKGKEFLQYTTATGEKIATITSDQAAYGAVKWVATSKEATHFVTSADGLVDIRGLAFGDYELKETKAPADYRLLITTAKFTVAETSWTTTKSQPGIVINSSMPDLPLTGGVGSLIFTLMGAGLVFAAYQINRRSKKA